jgi:hypothetical protein
MSSMRAWMVPLCSLGSMPMLLTISEHVAGPPLIRVERIEARRIEGIIVSGGCGGMSPMS